MEDQTLLLEAEVEQWLVVEDRHQEECQAVVEHVVWQDNHLVQEDTVEVEEQDQYQKECREVEILIVILDYHTIQVVPLGGLLQQMVLVFQKVHNH